MTFDIGSIHKSTPFLLADVVELLLVVGYEGYKTLHKNSVESILSSCSISEEEVDEQIPDGISDAEANDIASKYYEDCWKHLEYRAGALKENYPFLVEGASIHLNENLGSSHKVYFLLLCSSRLRSFTDKKMTSRWASYFTQLSREVMRSLLPENSLCHIFDANSDDRKNIYGTDLRKALPKLSEAIGATALEENIEDLSASGDKGIDLVGFTKAKDSACSNFVVFGQCAAREKEWPSKILEASPHNLRNTISFSVDPMNVVFIPVCFRKSSGDWYNRTKISSCLLIDRVRAFHYLSVKQKCSITSSAWFESFSQDLERVRESNKKKLTSHKAA